MKKKSYADKRETKNRKQGGRRQEAGIRINALCVMLLREKKYKIASELHPLNLFEAAVGGGYISDVFDDNASFVSLFAQFAIARITLDITQYLAKHPACIIRAVGVGRQVYGHFALFQNHFFNPALFGKPT